MPASHPTPIAKDNFPILQLTTIQEQPRGPSHVRLNRSIPAKDTVQYNIQHGLGIRRRNIKGTVPARSTFVHQRLSSPQAKIRRLTRGARGFGHRGRMTSDHRI